MLLKQIIDFPYPGNPADCAQEWSDLALEDFPAQCYAAAIGADFDRMRVRYITPQFGANTLDQDVIGNILRPDPVLRPGPDTLRAVREVAPGRREAIRCLVRGVRESIANHSATPCSASWID
jgi:hypothetical protein